MTFLFCLDILPTLFDYYTLLSHLRGFKIVSSPIIGVGSLVRADQQGRSFVYFIIPGAAGHTLNIIDFNIQLISPASPIARALYGHSAGDEVIVKMPDGLMNIRIIKVE